MQQGGTTNYYHADGLGTITSLSNAAGVQAQTYKFDSFGKQTASLARSLNPFQYTAREFDSETSLYFYRARYYDATTGRFLDEDPIGLVGGINPYVYTRTCPRLCTTRQDFLAKILLRPKLMRLRRP